MKTTYFATIAVAAITVSPFLGHEARAEEDCLGCHDDASLETSEGRKVGVDPNILGASAHKGMACRACHTQTGDYSSAPHFDRAKRVDCKTCHAKAVASFEGSFHAQAAKGGNPNAPSCGTCHKGAKGSHGIQPLSPRTAESACRTCHETESKRYDTSVHAAAAGLGKPSPGCTGCHDTHSPAYPPSAGAVNRLCENCHKSAMQGVAGSPHGKDAAKGSVMSCASCHDVHATHKPHRDETTLAACTTCHPDHPAKFKGSVHEELFASGDMTCFSCHRTHQIKDASEGESFGCGACHSDVEATYRKSAHRMARLRGNKVAATCGSCHDGHHVLAPDSADSTVNHKNIPNTCGKCHTERAVITNDFVRLPISLPSYTESVHGQGWKQGKHTAVCTDCHGVHDLQTAASPDSSIHKENLAQTCGKCHSAVSKEYQNSVHGRAVAHGIMDSPTCTDCHAEHMIIAVKDPRSPVRPEAQVMVTCAKCHEDPTMSARYGLPPEVIGSYKDSYHGWAIARGGQAVAVCTDCHNKHAIGSLFDPNSSIHKNNVVKTCGKCHTNSNAEFAASYNHVVARGKMMIHDWVRLVYLWLLALVLGGMFLHNLLIYLHEIREHYREVKHEPSVQRMTRAAVIQHWLLLVSFFGLALSGFALRFPDSWWAQAMTAIGFNEQVRRLFHRIMAVALLGASFLHVFQVALSLRGRLMARLMFPKLSDIKEALQSVLYYLGRRKEPAAFGMFDYTQKAEYWALIWGTFVMAATGFVLWFPTQATQWLPAWSVRVAEVIHFYEAILAVSAIFIWHFFFVIIRKDVYPMSFTWINGRMPMSEWRHHHARAEAETQGLVAELPADEPTPDTTPKH